MLVLMFCALSIAAQDFGNISKEPFAKGLYKVRSGEYYGIYDEKDNVIVSVEYNDIIFPQDSIALLKKSDGCVYGTITMSGIVSFFAKPFLYNPDYPFYSEGLLPVQHSKRYPDDKWFYIDSKGNSLDKVVKMFVMPQYYRRTMPFNDGFASVVTMMGQSMHIDKEGNKRFVIEDERVIYRSTVNCGEAVIITENGIKLYQEDKTPGSYKANVKRVITPSYNWKVANGATGRILQFVDGSLHLDYLGRATEFVPIVGPIIKFMEQPEAPEPPVTPEETTMVDNHITISKVASPVFLLEDITITLKQPTVTAKSNGYATSTVLLNNNSDIDSKILTVKIVSTGINQSESLVKIPAHETESIKLSLPAKFSNSQKDCDLTVTVTDGEKIVSEKLTVTIKRFKSDDIL